MKRYLKVVSLISLVLFLLALPAVVNYVRYMVPRTALPEARLKQVVSEVSGDLTLGSDATDLLSSYLESAGMPGVSAAVSAGDSVWMGAAGLADIENEKPVSLDTRFRIGSTAKPVTSTALARLVEAGQVELARPASDYKAGLPEHLQGLTLRQLASHTAGIRHYSWKDFNLYTGKKWTTAENGLAIFKNDPLLFEPGTDFSYSTYGYTLLGEVMAAASGRDFLDLIDREVFRPAGLVNTSADLPYEEVPGRASFYTTADGKYSNAPPQDVSYKWAGGGIVSTPSDMVRFGQALLAGELVGEQTRDLFWTPVLLADASDNPQGYGLGWRRAVSTRLLGEDRPTLMMHHGGRQVGGASFFAIMPELNVVVSALTNTGDSAARDAVQDLAYDLARLAINRSDAGESNQAVSAN